MKVFADRLACARWTIPYDDIEQAVLSSFKSPVLRIPGYVLAVKTKAKTYHFGLNGGRYWKGELPFTVDRQRAALKMSLVSLVARLVLIGYGAYFLWRWLRT